MASEPLQICRRGGGVDQAGERRRVGRDHELVGQPASEPEPRYAKCPVLVVAGAIRERVCRLRDAPWHAPLAAVLDLTPHARAAAVIQQRPREVPHQQEGHEVLEHRPAPGHERRAAVNARHESSEMKPVMLRNVTLRNGHEACQARFGGEQIIEGVVEPRGTVRIGETVTNRENAAMTVVQKRKSHVVDERRSTRDKVQHEELDVARR